MSAPPLVALTGATGFLGGAIARVLSRKGYAVRALARDPARLLNTPGLQPLAGDLRTPASLSALVQGADAVIHCAGLVKARTRAEFFRVNAEAAAALADACVNAAARRFVLISSLGAREPRLSDYTASKAAGEEAVRERAGLAATILRPCAIYGAGDPESAKLLRVAAAGFLPVLGPPQARISLIHVHDCATAALAALESEGTVGRTYEVDDGHGGYSWAQMAQALSSALGRPVRPLPTPLPALALAAQLNAWRAALLREAAMLTPGKARELAHPDWAVRLGGLQQDSDWAPRINLEQGFREACSAAHRGGA